MWHSAMTTVTWLVEVRRWLSVAVKVITCVPTSPLAGVQFNVVQTGLPLAGSGGVSVAPGGSGLEVSVSTSAGFESAAQIWKLSGTPTLPIATALQTVKFGGTFGEYV